MSGGGEKLLDAASWISVSELSGLGDLNERNARDACKRCHEGGAWRGTRLDVRKRNGKAYEVSVASLPPALQAKWLAAQPAPLVPAVETSQLPAMPENPSIRIPHQEWVEEAKWKRALIEPALAYRAGSRERGSIIKDIAARKHTKPCGKVVRIPARTLYEWLERLEALGIDGLVRKRRNEKAPRVLISRKWDLECPLQVDSKSCIKAAIETYIKSLYANASPGWRDAARLGQTELVRLSHAAGWQDASLESCKLTRHFVEKFDPWRLVHTKENDAKRLFDEHQPRIIRDHSLLLPMQEVVGDVHPVDILVTRADGSSATPRLIAWYDVATHRIFATTALLDKNAGVTRADVWKSFAAMVEAWGLPERLYLDNGSEYNGRKRRYGKGAQSGVIEGFNTLSAINMSMRQFMGGIYREFTAELVDITRDDSDQEQAPADEMRGSGVTRSQPHNAPGKAGVEGAFASVEKVLAMLPGYIGGDRMKKRTQKVGKEPHAWGSEAEFEAAFAHALAFWHNKEQDGNLNRKSPNEAFADAQNAGWRATPPPDRDTLIYAMSETLQRTVQTCGVEIDGRWYENSVAFAGLRTQKITLRYASWAPEQVIYAPNFPDPKGAALIELARVYHPLDRTGARDASNRKSNLLSHISSLKKETVPLDIPAEMARDTAARPAAPETLFDGPVISLGVRMDGQGQSAKRLPPAPPAERQLMPGEYVDSETGEVISFVGQRIHTRKFSRHEQEKALIGKPQTPKKQGAGR